MSDSYPFTVESLSHALSAANRAVSLEEMRSACGDGGSQLARVLSRVVVASAPHAGAAALLDYADELYGVGEPECECLDCPEWDAWGQARALRERASDMVNWDTPTPTSAPLPRRIPGATRIPSQRESEEIIRKRRVFVSFSM